MKQAKVGDLMQGVASWNPPREARGRYIDYIDLGAINNVTKLIENHQTILADEAPSRARQKVEAGDILISTVRPYLNGVARVPEALGGATASTGFCVVRADKEKASPEYLFQWFKSPQFVADMTKKATGASYPAVSDRIIFESEIPLPPIDEQQRIAAILDQGDTIRRKRQYALERLNQLGQVIFIEMFGDPKTNPKGWNSERLGDLCDVGSSKRVFAEDFVDSGVPFYRGTEVGKLGECQNIEPTLFITPEHYSDLVSHSGKPELGDLLLPSICHDGRIWKVDSPEPFYFKDGRVLWIKSHQANIDSEYLRRCLQNKFLFDYASIASGTTFSELKIINLKNLKILNPPLELQKTFLKAVEAVETTKNLAVKQSQVAEALFNSLQNKAFGRARVSSAAATLSAAAE